MSVLTYTLMVYDEFCGIQSQENKNYSIWKAEKSLKEFIYYKKETV